ncbi:MAG: hypothetical protein QNJ97_18495 [Myxococcota bacterium]|nr:hypothetical protein [Myxococcota bacterium]
MKKSLIILSAFNLTLGIITFVMVLYTMSKVNASVSQEEAAEAQTSGPYRSRQIQPHNVRPLVSGMQAMMQAARSGVAIDADEDEMDLAADDLDPFEWDDREMLQDGTERIASFAPTSTALTIEQNGSGALAVYNTDPDLAGQFTLVSAVTTSGQTIEVPIIIPNAE